MHDILIHGAEIKNDSEYDISDHENCHLIIDKEKQPC